MLYITGILTTSDDNIFLHLQRLLEDGEISPTQTSKFYASARPFYVQAMEYALVNHLLKNELLRNDKFLNFSSRKLECPEVNLALSFAILKWIAIMFFIQIKHIAAISVTSRSGSAYGGICRIPAAHAMTVIYYKMVGTRLLLWKKRRATSATEWTYCGM